MKFLKVDGRCLPDLDLERWWRTVRVGVLGNVTSECDLVVVVEVTVGV